MSQPPEHYAYEPFPGGDDRPTAPRRPRELKISVVLWGIFAVLLAASAVFSTIFVGTFIDLFVEQGMYAGVSEDEARTAAQLGAWISIGLVYLIAIVSAVLTYLLFAGRNWARILLSVIGVFFALTLAISLVTGTGNIPFLFVCVLVVAAAVVMWLPSVSAFLAAAKAARTG